ncbi:hypothetical protein TanjilG_03080 [Lupinus angustifolius]|uniref:Uncharacterized protein n=1 Tax=Lupinus angustifolius TaxID=3871 RepID=A0A4P1RCP1_LUPAN|nr:PREDICTED: transcription factor MYB34-like [Lupinus angustifolius]OIW08404.1 hypothetical protein TanjilG_03080 [Lupinus angustifolius]
MVRTPYSDKNGIKKGTWTPEEDRKLLAYVTKYGHWNWRQLPKFADLARCGKSCRLRWKNYLKPGIKRGNYTQEEEETIVKLHAKFGNRWSKIASHLPGRSDNGIKNHWHACLKKHFQHNSVRNEKAVEPTQEKDVSLEINDPFHNNSPSTPQTRDASPSSQQTSVSDILCSTAESASDGNYLNMVQDVDQVANFLDIDMGLLSGDFYTTEFDVADFSYIPGELYARFVSEPECLSPVYDAQLWGL